MLSHNVAVALATVLYLLAVLQLTLALACFIGARPRVDRHASAEPQTGTTRHAGTGRVRQVRWGVIHLVLGQLTCMVAWIALEFESNWVLVLLPAVLIGPIVAAEPRPGLRRRQA